jgi:lipopolysaccharide/colanic/teichoic acid biosynthesis glycosyltransferase
MNAREGWPELQVVSGTELHKRVLEYASSLDSGWRRFRLGIKRALDLVGATLGLILLAPWIALLVVLVKIESPGPAFFRQRRLGRFGRLFTLYKLRSMQWGAKVVLNPDGSTRVVKGDSRVTRLGRIMRTLGLDELPQLVNVMKGEMSLIGPRPDQDFHLQFYGDGDYRKLAMRPGMTSLGQVSGRNAIPWKERTLFEIEYVEHFSLWLDAKIVLRTLFVVVTGLGGYNGGNEAVASGPSNSEGMASANPPLGTDDPEPAYHDCSL